MKSRLPDLYEGCRGQSISTAIFSPRRQSRLRKGHEGSPIHGLFYSFVSVAQRLELASVLIATRIPAKFLYTLLAPVGLSQALMGLLDLLPSMDPDRETIEDYTRDRFDPVDGEDMMLLFAISFSLTLCIKSAWHREIIDRMTATGYHPLLAAQKSRSNEGKATTVKLLLDLRVDLSAIVWGTQVFRCLSWLGCRIRRRKLIQQMCLSCDWVLGGY